VHVHVEPVGVPEVRADGSQVPALEVAATRVRPSEVRTSIVVYVSLFSCMSYGTQLLVKLWSRTFDIRFIKWYLE
jgi:hypothetical protein